VSPEHEEPDLERQGVLDALRLVGSLGLTVVGTITLFFLAGLWLSKRFQLGALPIVGGVVLGVALAFLWVYRRLARHLDREARTRGPDERADT